MINTKHGVEENSPSEPCVSEVLLCRYLDKKVTKKERDRIEKHLNSCTECFEIVASMIGSTETKLTAKEELEVEKAMVLTPAEQAIRIVNYYQELNPAIKPAPASVSKSTPEYVRLINYIKQLLKKMTESPVLHPTFAVVVVGILVFSIWMRIRYNNTNLPIKMARYRLEENYVIKKNQPQLDGNYHQPGLSALLAADRKVKLSQAYLDTVSIYLMKAKQHHADSITVNRLLAQVAYMKGDYDKAIAILKGIDNQSVSSAGLKNDLGVIYFQQGDWKRAAALFEQAIALDANFAKAYFNLALVKSKSGDYKGMDSLLSRYIEREKDEGWRNIAHNMRASGENLKQ